MSIIETINKGILPILRNNISDSDAFVISKVCDKASFIIQNYKQTRVSLVILARKQSVMSASQLLFGFALKKAVQEDRELIRTNTQILLSYASVIQRFQDFTNMLPELGQSDREDMFVSIFSEMPENFMDVISELEEKFK